MGIYRCGNRRIKKFIMLVLALAACLCLMACAEKRTDNTPSETSDKIQKSEVQPQLEISEYAEEKYDATVQKPSEILIEGTVPTEEERDAFLKRREALDNICSYVKKENAIYGITEAGGAVLISLNDNEYYYENNGTPRKLKILETVDGYPVVGIAEWAADMSSSVITEIELPSSIRVLEDYAFDNLIWMDNTSAFNVPKELMYVERHSIDKAENLYEEWKKESEDDMLILGKCLLSCESKEAVLMIPEGVEIISEWALEQCAAETLILPESIKEVNSVPAGMKHMNIPSGLVQLRNVSKTPWFYEKTEQAGNGMFIVNGILLYAGSWGEEVSIPEGVWQISGAFHENETLSKIRLPESMRVIDNAFVKCSALQEVIISDNVVEIGEYSFSECVGLKEVRLGKKLRQIREGAFMKCTRLENIELPEGIKGIGKNAFSGCDALKELTVPGSVLYIGDYAFEACSRMENLTLSEGVKRIDAGAFTDCTSLKEIEVPDSVEFVGELAFYNCTNVRRFRLGNGVEFVEFGIFGVGDKTIGFEVAIELPPEQPELIAAEWRRPYFSNDRFGRNNRTNTIYVVHRGSEIERKIQKHNEVEGWVKIPYRYYDE